MRTRRVLGTGLALAVMLALSAAPVSAHEQPAGAEWVMADWMLLSFLAFMGAALVVFLVAVKRGMLRDLESAKYHILTLDEPDYYTPAWAKEESDAAQRER